MDSMSDPMTRFSKWLDGRSPKEAMKVAWKALEDKGKGSAREV
jgi:hypothetical protein